MLVELSARDRERIAAMGRGAGSALRVHHELQRRPLATVRALMGVTGLSKPTAGKAVASLVEAGVLREATGRRRNRVFAYAAYLDLLNKGTEA
jgi:Fic family protein